MAEFGRKRGYSQAFQLALGTTSNRHTQLPKVGAASSIFGPVMLTHHENKENESPFDEDKEDTRDEFRPVIQYPPGLTPHLSQRNKNGILRGQPLRNITRFCSNNGTSLSNLTLRPKSHVDGNVLCANLSADPGPIIYEDEPTTGNAAEPIDSPLHSVLSMQNLAQPDHTFPRRLIRPVSQQLRSSTHMFPVSGLVHTFPDIHPDDVIIFFSKGQRSIKMDKYPLFAASRFFTQMLDGPSIFGYIRVIRLRGDFTYAIDAMVEFIETGKYTFHPNMRIQHPYITMLDLHIHAYIVGAKYDVPQLCHHAINQYIDMAHSCLENDVDDPAEEVPLHISDPSLVSSSPSFLAQSKAAVVGSFLDSLALLWHNTLNRHDPMRAAALELVKHHLRCLSRFPSYAILIKNVAGFSTDISESLGDDGLEIRTYLVPEGEQGGLRFA